MVYVSRKVVYPAFIVSFAIVFFVLIYFFSISQSLVVENSRVEIDGDSLVFYSEVTNISNNYVRNISLDLVHSGGKTTYRINDLSPNESTEVVVRNISFSDNLTYDVFIKAPFNRTINIPFILEQETVRPVTAEVFLNSSMIVGQEYDYVVTICNVSNNALIDVLWSASTSGTYFEQPFIPQVLDLGVNQCKNLNSTLTPIRPGNIKINFMVAVGRLEQNYSYEISINEVVEE